MSAKLNNIEAKIDKALDYFPVIIFLIVIFTFGLFHVSKPAALLIATFISLFSFLIQAAALGIRSKRPSLLRPLYLTLGMLTIVVVIIFLINILDWYHAGEYSTVWAILLLFILIYFVLLFRAIHIFQEIKRTIRMANKQ
jgi:Kef-type K+ transport system membrane component KefB